MCIVHLLILPVLFVNANSLAAIRMPAGSAPPLHTVLDHPKPELVTFCTLERVDVLKDPLKLRRSPFLNETPVEKKKRIALAMTISGSVLLVVGSVVLLTTENKNQTGGDFALVFQTVGVLALLGGLYLLVSGIIGFAKL